MVLRRFTRLLALYLLGGCLSLGITGCVQPIDYQPNTILLQELTREDATTRIREVLRRSINPHITEVTVTENFITYNIHPTTVGIKLFFERIKGAQVFDNHAVFVQDISGSYSAQVFFSSAEDAKTYADLLMSFREAYIAQQARQ